MLSAENTTRAWQAFLAAALAVVMWWVNQPSPGPVVDVTPPVVAPVTPPVTPQPAPVTPPVPIPGVEPALVIVTDRDGKRITDAAVEAVAGKLAVGVWTVVAIPAPGDRGWTRYVSVSEAAPVPPNPVPPGPPPLPVPPVVPPVVVTPPPVTPPVTPAPQPKATAATYIYEKDLTAPPLAVLAALNVLNRDRGMVATTFEQDTKDGTGNVPAQYKVPLQAAIQAGLPALVVTSGEKVIAVVKDPKTSQAVLEAVP